MKGKGTVIVTGSGSGIGYVVAVKLIESGFDLMAVYRRSSTAIQRLRTVAKKHGTKFVSLRCDLCDIRSVATLADRLASMKVMLSGVVHCAGVNEKRSYRVVTPRIFDDTFHVNVGGPLWLTRAVLPLMPLARDGGASVVFVGSSYSFIGGGENNVLYTASKSALLGFTKSLAKLLAPHVRVNCVVPGFIESEMLFERAVPSYLNKKWQRIPLGRFGMPDEIADAICFLLSEKARYITGQAIHVNGGLYLG